jgi:hypothetical protein
LATDAAFIVEVDDAVRTAKQRHCRADLDARRVVAVIATQYGEVATGVGILPFLGVLDAGSIHAGGDVVFFLQATVHA